MTKEKQQGNLQSTMTHAPTRHTHNQPPTALLASINPRAEPRFRRLIDQLIESRKHIIRKLNLGHRPEPLKRRPDRKPHDPLLAERRVEDALVAKLVCEVHAAAEDAAEGDVFAEEEHAGVAAQGVREGRVDGLEQVLACRVAIFGAL